MRSKRRAQRRSDRLFHFLMACFLLAGTVLIGEAVLLYLHIPLPWQEQLVQAAGQLMQHTPQPGTKSAPAQGQRPPSAAVTISAQSQEPELYNGCEVTSLSMLLSAAGQPVSKMALAAAVPKDNTPEQQDSNGNTIYWGNPNQGFVGDVTGASRGYGVYHGPVFRLLQQYLPNKALDLTGSPFDVLLDSLAAGRPLVVWTTVDFQPPNDFVTWNSPSGQVHASFSEHAVLLVGYAPDTVTVIDPLDGQQKQVNRQHFQLSWEQMGRQAVTFK